MLDVSTTVTIAAPRDRVAGYAADPVNAPAWYAHVHSGGWLLPGKSFALVARVPGRTMRFVYDVVEDGAPDRLVFRTTQGPLPMETTYRFAADSGGGTVMTLHNRSQPRGLARLAAPLVARAMRRSNRRDLQRLKAILEGRDG